MLKVERMQADVNTAWQSQSEVTTYLLKYLIITHFEKQKHALMFIMKLGCNLLKRIHGYYSTGVNFGYEKNPLNSYVC